MVESVEPSEGKKTLLDRYLLLTPTKQARSVQWWCLDFGSTLIFSSTIVICIECITSRVPVISSDLQ